MHLVDCSSAFGWRSIGVAARRVGAHHLTAIATNSAGRANRSVRFSVCPPPKTPRFTG